MPSLTLPSVSSVRAKHHANHDGLEGPLPRSRAISFISIAAAGSLADLLTKHWMFQWLGFSSRENIWWLWQDYVGIQTTLNPGALFGMGEGGGRIFAALSIVAAISIVLWLFVFRAAKSSWLTVALALITGGILGNLYDRLGFWVTQEVPPEYHYAVRDWILFRVGEWSWPNFNIADSLLVSGAAMLLWQAYQTQEQAVPASTKSSADVAA
jgi:signal peptidase II